VQVSRTIPVRRPNHQRHPDALCWHQRHMRTFVRSNTIGTTRTLTCAAVASLTDIDFRDITIAGAAAPVSGTRLGDCKGNTGITFAAGTDKYWNLAGGGTWSSTAWALSSGGALAMTTSRWHRTPAYLRLEARTLAQQSRSTQLQHRRHRHVGSHDEHDDVG
jgi:hypothetical protein